MLGMISTNADVMTLTYLLQIKLHERTPLTMFIQVVYRREYTLRIGDFVPFNVSNKTFLFQLNMQVSWVRHRDIHLLTVGRYTYTSDQRFRAIHLPHSEDWTLQVNVLTTSNITRGSIPKIATQSEFEIDLCCVYLSM